MREKIAAVILNYKHLSDTIACAQSIQKTDLGKQVKLFVVDNSPSQKNQKTIKEKFPTAAYIASPSNKGFANGNNQGIQKALSENVEYVLIINPDVSLPQKFFVPLLKHFQNKNVGIVGPAIAHRQKDGEYIGLDGKVDWSLAKPEHRNLKQSEFKASKPINADFVTFACVLISKKNFGKVGLLDDGYFMYFEDVDYCLSTKQQKMDIILDPTVIVRHQTSSSFTKPTGKLFISFKSHLRFINKWLPISKRIIPLLHAFLLYPYLYVLWTYHFYKYH